MISEIFRGYQQLDYFDVSAIFVWLVITDTVVFWYLSEPFALCCVLTPATMFHVHGLYSGLFLRLMFYYLSCPLILSWPLDIVIWYLVCFIDFVLSRFLDIIMIWFMSHVLLLPVEFFCIMINCCSDFFFSK